MLNKLLLISVIIFGASNTLAGEIAENVWLCANCGDPYTENGLTNFTKHAHNIAFGPNKQPIFVESNGKVGNSGPKRFEGLKIANGKGDIVSVAFRPSFAKLTRMLLGLASEETIIFRMELPNNSLRDGRIIYRPNTDYAITPPPNQDHIDDYLHSAEASTMSMDYIIMLSMLEHWNQLGIRFGPGKKPKVSEEPFPPGAPVPPHPRFGYVPSRILNAIF